MSNGLPFVGRRSELALAQELAGMWTVDNIVCFYAEGGAGKSRLLREIKDMLAKSDYSFPLTVADVIDFDDQSVRTSSGLGLRISRILDQRAFEAFFRQWLSWRELEADNSPPERLVEQSNRVADAFVDCFNSFSQSRRVVLFFDSTDVVQQASDIVQFDWFLIRLLPRLRNVLVFLAGRNAQDIGKRLTDVGVSYVIPKKLSKLRDHSSRSLMEQRSRHLVIPIEPDLIPKVLNLADGRPIVLEMVIEWRKRGIELDWLVQGSINESGEENDRSSKRLSDFERLLVQPITQTRTKMDWLVLWLCRLYPLNPRMIAKLLPLENSEAENLFEEAKQSVLMKTVSYDQISLHDKVRQMVEDYVWDVVDRSFDLRQTHSRRALDVLRGEIDQLAAQMLLLEQAVPISDPEIERWRELERFVDREILERKRWVLQGDYLFHSMFVDTVAGLEKFVVLFDEATRSRHLHSRDLLFDKVEHYRRKLDPNQEYEVDSRRVRHLRELGRNRDASSVATRVLSRHDLSSEQEIHMLIQRGNAEIRLGSLEQGLNDFDEAVQISNQSSLDAWRMRALNDRGWAQRINGDYVSALKDYLHAYELSLDLNDQAQLASILNNMAYVQTLQGDRAHAQENGLAALEIWMQIGDSEGQGRAYSTLGEISRWLHHLEQAGDYFDKALHIFERTKNREWSAMVHAERASLYRTQRKLPEARNELDLARENSTEHLKPRIYYENAKISWLEDDLDTARQEFEECLKISQRVGDRIYEFMSFVDLVELAWEFETYGSWRDLLGRYNESYASRDDAESMRFRGSLFRKLGDLAICNGDYSEALDFYKEGLPLIARYQAHQRHSIREQLADMDRRLRKCAECAGYETIGQVGRDLYEFWKSNPELSANLSFALIHFRDWSRLGEQHNE